MFVQNPPPAVNGEGMDWEQRLELFVVLNKLYMININAQLAIRGCTHAPALTRKHASTETGKFKHNKKKKKEFFPEFSGCWLIVLGIKK